MHAAPWEWYHRDRAKGVGDSLHFHCMFGLVSLPVHAALHDIPSCHGPVNYVFLSHNVFTRRHSHSRCQMILIIYHSYLLAYPPKSFKSSKRSELVPSNRITLIIPFVVHAPGYVTILHINTVGRRESRAKHEPKCEHYSRVRSIVLSCRSIMMTSSSSSRSRTSWMSRMTDASESE